MGRLDAYMPTILVLVLQFIYAGVAILTRAALTEGLNPRVYVVYRQAAATLIFAPIAFFSRRKAGGCSMGWKSFSLIFLISLIGVTISQYMYYEGLCLTTSSAASALFNIVPAITFVVAAIVGFEKINIKSTRSIAKIIGTVVCVSGAAAMALLKGPKLLNAEEFLSPKPSYCSETSDQWLLGCLFIFASSCCWAFWTILQVPVTKSYPDHLSLSAWMCIMALVQSAGITYFLEPHWESWKIHSFLEIGSCMFSGVAGSGIAYMVQAWVIQQRGPVFSSMFNPLNTLIVAIFASIFLNEVIYVGSIVGAFGIVLGLYAVLWGKAKDLEVINDKPNLTPQSEQEKPVQILIDHANCRNGLEEPLLSENSDRV